MFEIGEFVIIKNDYINDHAKIELKKHNRYEILYIYLDNYLSIKNELGDRRLYHSNIFISEQQHRNNKLNKLNV